MAIDTAPKRKSAAGVSFLPLGPGVTPNAAKPVAWRQQAGWGYSGIEAGAAQDLSGVATSGTLTFTPLTSGTLTHAVLTSGTLELE